MTLPTNILNPMSNNLKLVFFKDFENNQMDSSWTTHSLVLYIEDVFSKNHIKKFKEQYPNIVTVISPNCTIHDLEGVEFYGMPLYLSQQAKGFARDNFSIKPDTKHVFTFNLNRKEINRFLLLKLVEWFELKSYCYTWSGTGREFDMSEVLEELSSMDNTQPFDEQTKSFLLSPVQLKKNFIDISNATETASAMINYGTNYDTWKSFLSQMTHDSAISLITEPVQHEKNMLFTEKTLYSVAGLTFPIWIGGYKQASEWEKCGFDTFSDVIDHSYQHHNTLIERIFYAFKNNYKLLNDLPMAINLRNKHMDRLLANRQRLLDNQLGNAVKQYFLQMPVEIQDLVNKHDILNKYKYNSTIG
jgi:hypothetical protein